MKTLSTSKNSLALIATLSLISALPTLNTARAGDDSQAPAISTQTYVGAAATATAGALVKATEGDLTYHRSADRYPTQLSDQHVDTLGSKVALGENLTIRSRDGSKSYIGKIDSNPGRESAKTAILAIEKSSGGIRSIRSAGGFAGGINIMLRRGVIQAALALTSVTAVRDAVNYFSRSSNTEGPKQLPAADLACPTCADIGASAPQSADRAQ